MSLFCFAAMNFQGINISWALALLRGQSHGENRAPFEKSDTLVNNLISSNRHYELSTIYPSLPHISPPASHIMLMS